MDDKRSEVEENGSKGYFSLHNADTGKRIGVYRESEPGLVVDLVQQMNKESGGVLSILARPITQSDYETLRERDRELLLKQGSF